MSKSNSSAKRKIIIPMTKTVRSKAEIKKAVEAARLELKETEQQMKRTEVRATADPLSRNTGTRRASTSSRIAKGRQKQHKS